MVSTFCLGLRRAADLLDWTCEQSNLCCKIQGASSRDFDSQQCHAALLTKIVRS